MFGKALGAARISAKLREQIAIAVSAANECDYCTSAHTAFAKGLGADDAEVAVNLSGRSGDPTTVDAALRFAIAVVEKRGWVSDEDVSEVRSAGHGDGEIVEIIATVAMTMFSNYFNHVVQPDVDFPKVEIGQWAAE